MIGLPMMLIVKNKKLKIAFFVLFFASLIVTLHLLNRTGLAVLSICTLGLIAYRSRHRPRVLFVSLLVLLAFVAGLKFFGVINEELIDFYMERNES